ncbi:MAG: putative metal-binding protein [Alteromonas macleodii]|jgi:predicted metal-binding protein
MADTSIKNGDRFIVCTGCSGGADLAKALIGRVAVETTDCMNVCDKPISFAVRATGKAAYLFTGVDPDFTEEIEAFAKLYAASSDGQIMDARAAGALRFCLVGRIPA